MKNKSVGFSHWTLRRVEFAAAAFLTAEAILLRVVAATSAGPLWRDEANTIGLVTLPTIRDVWAHIHFDSFPMLWLLVVRQLSEQAGPMNNAAFRVFGLIVGILTVAVLWFYARTFRYSVPLASLALLGLAPSVIVWGDSLRGYGLGILVILLCGLVLWRFVVAPTAGGFVIAAVIGILSVHLLYYNAVLLFAFCCGAATVAATKRSWKTFIYIGLIGVIAAFSLVPYTTAIRAAGDWNIMFRVPEYTVQRFWSNLNFTLAPGGPWSLVLWAEVFVLALVAAGRAIRYPGKLGHSPAQRDVALFASVTLIVGTIGIFVFLKTLSYVTQPWYYIALLASAAVCIDAISGSLIHSERARVARVASVLLIGVATFIPAFNAVKMRMTNVDRVATRTQSVAIGSDFIVISQWEYGVSWNRYYRGLAKWTTIPPIGFHRWHRPDIIKKGMIATDPAAPVYPVESRIAATLRAGHRVFIVGGLPLPPPGQNPALLARPTLHANGWAEDYYDMRWYTIVGYFIQQHATNVVALSHASTANVSNYENVPLLVATGWRP